MKEILSAKSIDNIYKEIIEEKKYMIIDIIDGDEIVLERCSSSD